MDTAETPAAQKAAGPRPEGQGAGFDPLAVSVKLRTGKAAARHLASLGIETVGDALNYAPRTYFHWGRLSSLAELTEGEETTVLAQVQSVDLVRNRSGKGVRLLVRITDGSASVTCTFFARNEYALSPHRRLLQVGESFLFAGKVSSYQGRLQLVQPAFEETEADSPEAVERRRGRPIPVYRAKAKLPSWKVSALLKQILEQVPWDQIPDPVPPNVAEKHGLLPLAAAYRKLHEPEDDADWQAARRTLAWLEALVLQTALLRPRALQRLEGKELSPRLVAPAGAGSQLAEPLKAGLPFELTPGQVRTWAEIETEIAAGEPMQRLLQADVGAGKTIVALLAMLRAVESGHQAVLLAPTEVLAVQHFRSIHALLRRAGIDPPLHLLTGSLSAGAKSETLRRLAAGEPALVVGTHALIQEGVEVPHLGLLVVDEQHRFGVAQRDQLLRGRELSPHLLVMTATPIPRTVAMTVFGDLDVSLMREMPPGRVPVTTYRVPEESGTWMARVWERAAEEIEAGGRVYVVVPRIAEEEANQSRPAGLPSIAAVVDRLRSEPALAGVGVGVAHGLRSSEENTAALAAFASGQAPLLVATSVVEVGVDVPEATMMVIWGAQNFGLSQLHQLRGRVGRSEKPAVCMLIHPAELNPTADERLTALVELDDGFALAEADLRLRREGDVLGQQQSGLASSLRFLSVQSDAPIISAARKEAQAILAEDPHLARFPGLARAVDTAWGEQIRWLDQK